LGVDLHVAVAVNVHDHVDDHVHVNASDRSCPGDYLRDRSRTRDSSLARAQMFEVCRLIVVVVVVVVLVVVVDLDGDGDMDGQLVDVLVTDRRSLTVSRPRTDPTSLTVRRGRSMGRSTKRRSDARCATSRA